MTNNEIMMKLIDIHDDIKSLRRQMQPAYIVQYSDLNKDAFEEIRDKCCKPLKPGQIIPLSEDAFELFKKMQPCPPRGL